MSGSDFDLIGWSRVALELDADRRRVEALVAETEGEPAKCDASLRDRILAELRLFAMRAYDAVWGQICLAAENPAQTQEGLRAKAEMVAALADGPYLMEDLSRSLANDVCRFTAPQAAHDLETAIPASPSLH